MVQHPIEKKLSNLSCTTAAFVEISGGLIGRTRLTQALKNEPGKALDHNLERKLLALVDEMAELKRTSLVAPDWSDAAGIREQLKQRRAFHAVAKDDETKISELLLEVRDGTEATSV